MKKTSFIILYKLVSILFICCLSISSWSQTSTKNKVLIIGDSLSAGYGLRVGSGWVSLLQKDWTNKHPDTQIINASISGETTAGGKQRISELLIKTEPTIVVVELGSNDALRGFPLETTRQNLLSMVKLAQDKKARVLIIGMQVPKNYGSEYTQSFQKMFNQIAKDTRASLVPFLLSGLTYDAEFFQDDNLHPNEKAQATIVKNVEPILEKLLR